MQSRLPFRKQKINRIGKLEVKIFGKSLNRKQEMNLRAGVRALIQVIFFILAPSIFTSAFSGVKYLFTTIGMREIVEVNAFIKVLLGLLLYTIIFGRFFCGYACAFGSMGDLFRFVYKSLCKKLKKKPISISKKVTPALRYIKYIVLFAIVLTCFLGAYGKTAGYSPWDVFSMMRAGNFAFSNYIPALVLLVLIIIGMCLEDRFFCRFLCPMGAVFSMMPILPFFTITRKRENCIKGCNACNNNCIADVQLADSDKYEVRGECFQCNKCVGVCPKQNIHTKIPKLRGYEIWFVALRALILFAFMKALGI